MKEVKPKAELFAHDKDAVAYNIAKIYAGYRRCYSGSTQIKCDGEEMAHAFIRRMLRAEHAHESPLEHASLTFHITCSRAASHQLVRHRIASYSQQSQRYVKMDDLPIIVPPTIQGKALEDFYTHLHAVEEEYKELLSAGIPAEDARYLLPHATATQVVVTMNFRSLLHFFNERCCNRAQWEIRDIANQMLEQCKQLYPCVFENAGAHCMKLKRCPEAKPCGKQPWKE
jgi:thymidylate synthase (FAD)